MYDPCMDCILQYKPKSLQVKVIAQIFGFFFLSKIVNLNLSVVRPI